MAGRVPVALVGCGNFARWQHLPNLSRSPLAELRLVCDRDAALAASVAGRYHCRACSEAAEVWTDPDIRAVVICVRDELQAGMALSALAAGKHVYVEKPLGTTPQTIARVESAAQASGLQLAVGFQKRFAPAYRLARELLRSRGGVRNLALRMADDAWRWATGYEPGDLLRHDVCHLFDLARWLCDSPVSSVHAARSRPDDDALLLTMADGCVVTIMASGHGSIDMPKERLDAICDRGGVVVEDFVELRAYGFDLADPIRRFPGSTHPDRCPLTSRLLAEQGAEGLATLRRIAGRLQRDQAAGRAATDDDRRLIASLIPNFLRDQGWEQALAAFLARVAGDTGAGADLAGASDALAASTIAMAAMRSRESGRSEPCLDAAP